jgi:hypothetical protein
LNRLILKCLERLQPEVPEPRHAYELDSIEKDIGCGILPRPALPSFFLKIGDSGAEPGTSGSRQEPEPKGHAYWTR